MERSLGNPFREDHKPRKPGAAGLVGVAFGENAKAAYEKQVSEGKKKQSIPVPSEDLEGADIIMSAEEKAKMQEVERQRKAHIDLENIPSFTKIPAEEILGREFKLDDVSLHRLSGRLMSDFDLTEDALKDIGLDAQTSASILESMHTPSKHPVIARVVHIRDLIRQMKRADPKHSNPLSSTREVLEAMDAAGYRPATFQELLSFSRDHWRPDVDSDDLTETERAQKINAEFVGALGSSTRGGDGREIAYLYDVDGSRELLMGGFGGPWGDSFQFLVVRK